MSNTATAADETRTGADALNELNVINEGVKSRTLQEELRIFGEAKAELKALTELVERSQAYLVQRIEETGTRSVPLDGKQYTVVYAVRRLIDGARAIPMLKRRGLYKKLTYVMVDERAYKSLVDTDVFPELKTAITESLNSPFIKIS